MPKLYIDIIYDTEVKENVTNMLPETICYLLSAFDHKTVSACVVSCFSSLDSPEKFILTSSTLQIFSVNIYIITVSCRLCL